LAGVALSGAALALVALIVVGPRSAMSVGVGGGIATGNLWALARIVAALVPAGTGDAGGGGERPAPETPVAGASAWALVGLLKMFGLFTVVWLLMRSAIVSPLAMVFGFAALPMGIAIGALVSDRGGQP
jgi:hypothetical protein